MKIESCEHYKLERFDFSGIHFNEMDTCLATIRMFMELKLIDKFQIPYRVITLEDNHE